MGLGGEGSFSFIHTQVARAVWGLPGWLWEEGGRRKGGRERETYPCELHRFRPSPRALALWPRPLTAI